ncbi:hypothetical protein [Crocinitomix catalasitica]|uniref:hypothetical protein n=1 Tax=Crocinitomix catalasitica TaxID=184607 RepID=UPI000481D44F|nr:hypothetical protein [Crocinitomix catalasitica]
MIRQTITLFLFIHLACSSWTQVGYFGSRHAVGITIETVPTIGYVSKVDAEKSNVTVKRKLLNMRFGLNYTFVASRKSELRLRYAWSKLYAYNAYLLSENELDYYYLLADIPLNFHHFSFDFRRFVKGNIAAHGKYIGFGLNTGYTKLKEGTEAQVGVKDKASEHNKFKSQFPILDMDLLSLGEVRHFYYQIDFSFGSVFSINHLLSLDIGVTIPLFTSTMTNGIWEIPGIEEIIFPNPFEKNYYYYYGDKSLTPTYPTSLVFQKARIAVKSSLDISLYFHL